MAGDEGFEPPNVGTKSRCLTTWRIPSMTPMYYTSTEVIAQALKPISTFLRRVIFRPERTDRGFRTKSTP
jgi:hypothetical protein